MKATKKKRPPISNYVTVEGEKRLRDELDYLWRQERPRVTQQVSDAAALGDRSENAEYIYGKKRLREIDRRVRHLRKRLEVLTVVDRLPTDTSRIYFGAWVTVEDEAGKEHRFRLVDPDEIGDHAGYISIDAPLGRAMLGKSVDAEISIRSPAGRKEWWVLEVDYEGPA